MKAKGALIGRLQVDLTAKWTVCREFKSRLVKALAKTVTTLQRVHDNAVDVQEVAKAAGEPPVVRALIGSARTESEEEG